MVRSSSAKRRLFPSTSKEAPEVRQTTLEFLEAVGKSHVSFPEPCSITQKTLLPPARISLRASAQNVVVLASSAPTCSTYSCQLFSISSLNSCGSVPSRSPCWRFSGWYTTRSDTSARARRRAFCFGSCTMNRFTGRNGPVIRCPGAAPATAAGAAGARGTGGGEGGAPAGAAGGATGGRNAGPAAGAAGARDGGDGGDAGGAGRITGAAGGGLTGAGGGAGRAGAGGGGGAAGRARAGGGDADGGSGARGAAGAREGGGGEGGGGGGGGAGGAGVTAGPEKRGMA